MLLESAWKGKQLTGIIAGIAINGNNELNEHMNAISIKEITKSNVDLQEIQTNILKSIDSLYEQFKQKNFNRIFSEWKKLQVILGKQITIHTKNGKTISGIAKNLWP